MRILVVSDYSTSKVGGAQVIAKLVGDRLEGAGYQVFTLEYPYSNSKNQFIYFNKVRSLINPLGLLILLAQQIRFRPDVIWYHSISNEWSYSSLRLNVFGARQIFTVHDLSILSNYKITPEILSKYISEKTVRKFVRRTRLRYIRACIRNCTTVGIGDICVAILKNFDIRIDCVIKNQVLPCTHTTAVTKIRKSLLFAGRDYMKGLEQVARAIARNPEWTLFLAGDEHLLDYASIFCPKAQINYLGKLSHSDLFTFIHRVELVGVCSQYFDNYPTISLEALAHDSLPFTSELTGVASLLHQINPKLVLRKGEIPPLEELRRVVLDHKGKDSAVRAAVTDIETFISEYLEVIGIHNQNCR